LAPELEGKGLLAPRYLDTFELFCTAVVHWRRAERLVQQAGPVIQGRMGEVVSNPAAREFARFGTMVRNLGADFGMSPAALTAMAHANAKLPDAESPARLLG